MDVTLNDDGTVKEVKVIESSPLFDEAAVGAVKQWRYEPLTVKGELVKNLAVVLEFGKDGKVK